MSEAVYNHVLFFTKGDTPKEVQTSSVMTHFDVRDHTYSKQESWMT